MKFFKKLFSKKDPESPSNDEGKFEIRSESLKICANAGFKPAGSLPTTWDRQLRPSIEIAGRLHSIKALVLWLMVPSENLSNDKILSFVDKNDLRKFMSKDEQAILLSARDDEGLRNAIGWKFENAWPLAWYFGYSEPEISGKMMSGEQIQEIFSQYTCSLDDLVEEWLLKQVALKEESVAKKEDLFYCLHNAVRSAQMGSETVPNEFDPVGNGGVIHERRHSLTWMLSKNIEWEETDLST